MDNYFDTQFAGMTEWIKLFQRMPPSQKFMIFTDSQKDVWYEGTVSEVTFEDLSEFAEYNIIEFSAKDGIFVFWVDKHDNE